MLQSLPLTLGVSNDVWIVLDALRKKRNQNDYTGMPLGTAEAQEAIDRAKELLTILQSHLHARHPLLLLSERFARGAQCTRAIMLMKGCRWSE
jgi:hypothetical protein